MCIALLMQTKGAETVCAMLYTSKPYVQLITQRFGNIPFNVSLCLFIESDENMNNYLTLLS